MEDPLTQREVHHAIIDIKDNVKEIKIQNNRTEETVNRVEIQARITNGRVTELEKWSSYIKGGLAVLTIMVVPILLWVITQFLNTSK